MNDNERSHRIRAIVLASRKEYLGSTNARRVELEALYRKAGLDLRNDIINASPDGDIRARDLAVFENLTNQQLGNLINVRTAFFATMLFNAASKGTGQAKPISKLLPGVEISSIAIETANAQAVAWLWDHLPEDGIQLSPRLWKNDIAARHRIVGVLEEGIASSEAIHRTTESILAGAADAEQIRVVQKAFGQTRAVNVARDVQALFTKKGQRNLVFNIERVLITESNRVYRRGALEAFRETGAIGSRWNLAAAHPRPDICDDHATADKHGLGSGGYPLDEYPDYPAHPLCLCFDTPIYAWEVN